MKLFAFSSTQCQWRWHFLTLLSVWTNSCCCQYSIWSQFSTNGVGWIEHCFLANFLTGANDLFAFIAILVCPGVVEWAIYNRTLCRGTFSLDCFHLNPHELNAYESFIKWASMKVWLMRYMWMMCGESWRIYGGEINKAFNIHWYWIIGWLMIYPFSMFSWISFLKNEGHLMFIFYCSPLTLHLYHL